MTSKLKKNTRVLLNLECAMIGHQLPSTYEGKRFFLILEKNEEI